MQADLDRRDRSLRGRVRRVTYGIEKGAGSILGSLPCSLISHKWVEVPPSLRSAKSRASGRMEYRCHWCGSVAGFH